MKTLLLTLFLFLTISTGFGQTNYYAGKDTLHIGNEIYTIRLQHDYGFEIANIKNDKIGQRIKYADGTPVANPRDVVFLLEDGGDNAGLWRAARETFTSEEILSLINDKVSVGYYVTPDGIITDVSFFMEQKSEFYAIPPERWLTLEEKIKQYQRFKLKGAEKYQHVEISGPLSFKNIYDE